MMSREGNPGESNLGEWQNGVPPPPRSAAGYDHEEGFAPDGPFDGDWETPGVRPPGRSQWERWRAALAAKPRWDNPNVRNGRTPRGFLDDIPLQDTGVTDTPAEDTPATQPDDEKPGRQRRTESLFGKVSRLGRVALRWITRSDGNTGEPK